MAVSKRSDQIFQLSLTEIAFILVFILLLLLGYVVIKEQREKKAALAALAATQGQEAAKRALDDATAEIKQVLVDAGAGNPDDVITKLVENAKASVELPQLKMKVLDLEAEVSALSAVKQTLANAAADVGKKEVADRVGSAFALQEAAEKALAEAEIKDSAEISPAQVARPASNTREAVTKSIEVAKALDRELKRVGGQGLPAGEEQEAIKGIVDAAEQVRSLQTSGVNVAGVRKENSDLRGQVANLRNRLEARGGRDYPPCWADESGKVEFLFSVELRSDVAVVTRAWPDRRNADAASLPGIESILTSPIPLAGFAAAHRPVFDVSRRQDPECRHYVLLRSVIPDAVQSDRARLMVENFFYKSEARR